MRCDRLVDVLPGLLDGEVADAATRHHIERCLRCQADLARYRRLRRTLAGLRAEQARPPVDLLVEVAQHLDRAAARGALDDDADPAARERDRRRAAYLGGLAVATAAGVGGVLVLAARGRRLVG